MHLAQWRRKRKMSQNQLAERLNVCTKTVFRMENGEMTAITAGRLLTVFGIQVLGVDEVAAFYPFLKHQSVQKQTQSILNHLVKQINQMNENAYQIKTVLPMLSKLLKDQGAITSTAVLDEIEDAPIIDDDLSFLEVD